MAVKVAINGFGRIGRLAFRQMFNAEGYEVVAINDLTSPAMLAHLLKYDTAQGKYQYADSVVAGDDYIEVCGKKITIYKMANAAELPWGEIGVDVVLECTGFYTSKAKAQAHIDAGAKKVVISAPAGNDLKTIVYSVNEKTLTAEDNIISAASCSLSPCSIGFRESCILRSRAASSVLRSLSCSSFFQEPFTTSCNTGISLAIFSVSALNFSIKPGIFSKAFRKFIQASCGSAAILPLL